jgi:hypothetical protein
VSDRAGCGIKPAAGAGFRKGPSMRRVVAIGVAAATFLAVNACSGGSGIANPGESAPPSAAPVPPATARLFSAIPLPLDAYRQTTGQLAVLTEAYNILDHRCMATKGYDYPPAQFLQLQQYPATPPNFMRYGEDTDLAADLSRDDYGHYLTGMRKGSHPNLPMSSAESAAQFGDSAGKAGGCALQASQHLSANGADLAGTAATVGKLDGQSFTASMNDGRVKAVIASWSACMRSRGFSAEAPVGKQINTFSWPREERLADVACKRQVDLVRIWSGVEARIQDTLISENAPALTAEERGREITVRNASAVIAANG